MRATNRRLIIINKSFLFDVKSTRNWLFNPFARETYSCFYFRMKMTSVFTSSKLKNLFLLMQESGEAMRDHLHDRFTNVSEVSFNVQDTFYRYTTNVISSVAFGIRTNCFDTPTPEFYKKCKIYVCL